jgi:hypothetical protein
MEPQRIPPGSRAFAPLLAAVSALGLCLPMLASPQVFIGDGGDMVALEYPAEAFSASRLRIGDLPLWNPYQLGGVPFQAGAHGLLSPSYWGAAFLGPHVNLKLSLSAHLALASAGAAWLASRRTGSWIAALVAGLGYGLSGFSVGHLFAGHRRLLATAAYLPWVVGLLDGAVRLRRGRGLLAGAALGLMLLTGHHQVVWIGMLGTGLWLLLEAWCRGPPYHAARLLGVVALSGALGVGLAGVQLLPLAETVALSQRADPGPEFAASFSAVPQNLLGLLCPGLFGDGVEAPFLGVWAFSESCLYLGQATLLLAAAAPLILPAGQSVPVLSVVLVGLVLALGPATPLYTAMLGLPGASLFRVPGRFLLLVALFGPLLAAQALDRWLRQAAPISLRRLAPLLLLPLLSLMLWRWIDLGTPEAWSRTAGLWGGRPEAVEGMEPRLKALAWAQARSEAGKSALLLGVGLALLAGGLRIKDRRAPAAAIVGLLALDLHGFGSRFLVLAPADRLEWPASLVRFLSRAAAPGLRILEDPSCVPPGRGAMLGISQVGGYEIFVDRMYSRYLLRAAGLDPSRFAMAFGVQGPGTAVDRLGAEYLVHCSPRPQRAEGWSPLGRFDGLWLFRDPDPEPRVFLVHAAQVLDEEEAYRRLADPEFDLRQSMLLAEPPPAGFEPSTPAAEEWARLERYEPDAVEISVHAAASGAVVLSDTWHPGWKAWVDGHRAPLVRANLVMRAVPVPAGRHKVRMEFELGRFGLGALLSGTALAVLAGGGLWLGRVQWLRRRKSSRSSTASA